MPILKVNDIVYVPGDYFDFEQEERWSEMMRLNWKTHSILGIIKSFHKDEVNVLWLIDFRESKVHIQDVTKLPKDLHPISGSIHNHTLNAVENIPKLLKNAGPHLDSREKRLSGTIVNIYYDYNPNEKSKLNTVNEFDLNNEYFNPSNKNFLTEKV